MAYSVYKGPIELPRPLFVEGEAQAGMKPGNIVNPDFTIGTAASVGLLLIIAEGGPGKGEGVDYDYVSGNQVNAYNAQSGQRFEVRFATGQAVVKNTTLLERGADGRLVVLAAGEAVAVAKESLTTSADDQLVEVEAL